MRQIPNPQTHVLTQPNTSDVLGDIFISKNLDLVENLGKVRVGTRLVVNTSTADAGTLSDVPIGFREHNSSGYKLYAVAGGSVQVSSADYPSSSFTADAGFAFTNPPNSAQSDIETYMGDMYVTTTTDLCKLAASSWSIVSTNTLGSGAVHLMCSYAGKLYITDSDYKIYNWDGSSLTKTGASTLDLSQYDPNIVITFMRAAGDTMWIGTINQAGDKAYIYKWDGIQTVAVASYKLRSAGVLSGAVMDDVLYAMDVYGRLLAWNGGTFLEKARLNRRSNKLFWNPFAISNVRFIHPNGMAVIGEKINILIDTRLYDSSGSVGQTVPSGIYEYDETIGLYHKHSFSMNHAADTITDYGANRISYAGGLYETNFPDTSVSRNGTFLAGANYYTSATVTTSAIFNDDSNDTLQKYGYMVTAKLEATDGSPYNLPTVEGMWQSFYTIYRKLLASTDKIISKYRINDLEPVEATITWLSTTTFTVPNSSVVVSNYWTATTGDEVEIMQGIGAGKCAHITNAVLSSGTWIVTLDETFTGVLAGVTSIARFQHWKKISAITPNNQNFNSDTISTKSTWLELKVCMQFSGKDEIERLLISNSNATPVK